MFYLNVSSPSRVLPLAVRSAASASSLPQRALDALRGKASPSMEEPAKEKKKDVRVSSKQASKPKSKKELNSPVLDTNLGDMKVSDGKGDSNGSVAAFSKSKSAVAALETAKIIAGPPSPNVTLPDVSLNRHEYNDFAPRICVIGVGGAGGNAINNMIARNLNGVDFLALNTDAQHLSTTFTDNRLQIGKTATQGLGCGANPDAGEQAALESKDEILEKIGDANMVFITAGMGGGTGTGAASVVADLCFKAGMLTVGVVTKPFRFEGTHRMRLADEGISRLQGCVDTMIVIPNQNLFHLVDPKTSLMDR